MFFVTRHIEPWTGDKPELCTKRFKKIQYTAKCTTCGHRCELTFSSPSVCLYAEEGKLEGALSLLCAVLAKEDKEDLVGTLRRILDARGK